MLDDPNPPSGDESGEPSLVAIAMKALLVIVAVMVGSYFAVQAYQTYKGDSYVVDYYPPTSQRTGRVVFRWPSQGKQLEPVVLKKLPASIAEKWGGNQPKRTTLEPTTILPGGRVIEADTSTPPGRFVVVIGRQTVTVSPDSDWTLGRPSAEPPE